MAKEAARLTGKSLTSVVEEALIDLLRKHGSDPDQARVKAKFDAATAIVADYRADPGLGAALDAEDLYDRTTGLPK